MSRKSVTEATSHATAATGPTRRVHTEDGLALAVTEVGPPDAPTIVCVHGYPDNGRMWRGVADRLTDRFHVVSYDVRGAGDSDKPAETSAYHLDRLEGDLVAVVNAVSPDRPVHLLAHDWGSIQAWHAVTGDRLAGRIRSYTSISGPSLDHAAHWFRSRLRPNPRKLRELLGQAAHSGYIGFFHLAPLPELAWRSGAGGWLLDRLERYGNPGPAVPADRAMPDLINGLKLYRANMFGRLRAPRERHTDIPVQVLAPTHDLFVSPSLQTDIGRWVPDLRVRHLPGGHWLPRSRPDVVARCTAELVAHVEGGPEARGLRRARHASAGRFGDQLVLVTGAGSGIGRATALAFAKEGADIIAADINSDAVKQTAEQVRQLGREASAYRVDVADAEAMTAFGDQVRAAHGVPDVVVNNAGIGMAGAFLDTTVKDWERVIDVNLWGVIHGSRVFGAQLAERGEGGRLVNVASAAAYLPSRILPAYATTKSAVLMLTECLRAELGRAGVGVVAICPGVVNTNITNTTEFVGQDESGQQAQRRRANKAYRRRGYGPERAAREILRAVERNTALAAITPEAKVALVLSRLTPGLLRTAAKLGPGGS